MPLNLALQYFGAERDIFGFHRNSTTFNITLLVLYIALPILTLLLGYLEDLLNAFRSRFGSPNGPKSRAVDDTGKVSAGSCWACMSPY